MTTIHTDVDENRMIGGNGCRRGAFRGEMFAGGGATAFPSLEIRAHLSTLGPFFEFKSMLPRIPMLLFITAP